MKILFYASEYAPEGEIHIIVPPETYADKRLIREELERLIAGLRKLED
jgi:hypothetical protein